jgi:(2Fe-2S) ferredoxin
MTHMDDELRKAIDKLGVGTYRRHVFLCLGPSCCSEAEGMKAWESLKQELKVSNLGNACQRTKVGCLRICCEGPTMVVYPEGTWYRNMTAERMARFVHEHLIAERPVEEWIFARNPIAAPSTSVP